MPTKYPEFTEEIFLAEKERAIKLAEEINKENNYCLAPKIIDILRKKHPNFHEIKPPKDNFKDDEAAFCQFKKDSELGSLYFLRFNPKVTEKWKNMIWAFYLGYKILYPEYFYWHGFYFPVSLPDDIFTPPKKPQGADYAQNKIVSIFAINLLVPMEHFIKTSHNHLVRIAGLLELERIYNVSHHVISLQDIESRKILSMKYEKDKSEHDKSKEEAK